MEGIKIVRSDENETLFTINDNVKVTIIANDFNRDGEMVVDYDETILTEQQATELVNSYFANLVSFLENKSKEDKIKELKDKLGEIE